MFAENLQIRKSEQLSLDYTCDFRQILTDFHQFSILSQPDRPETIQSHRFSRVDGRSVHHTAANECSKSQFLTHFFGSSFWIFFSKDPTSRSCNFGLTRWNSKCSKEDRSFLATNFPMSYSDQESYFLIES